MSNKESNIDTRTPDEMLDGAMKRIISIAEAVIKAFPRLQCIPGRNYRYSFDKTMVYTYIGCSEDFFFHYFIRNDGQKSTATKYSESPEEV